MTKHEAQPIWGTPLYNLWQQMKNRCTNPRNKGYAAYGGRGITVCDRWQDFQAFHDDMGERPPGMSLDRIDNDLGYGPDNCRWATRKTQQRNRRNNVILTAFGKSQSVAAWAEEIGMPITTLYARVTAYGWTHEKAIRTPVQQTGRWNKQGGGTC
jgi:hypothetical protein